MNKRVDIFHTSFTEHFVDDDYDDDDDGDDCVLFLFKNETP